MSKIILTFTPDELNLIGKALDLMPFGVISPLVNAINKQIVEQREKTVDEGPV